MPAGAAAAGASGGPDSRGVTRETDRRFSCRLRPPTTSEVTSRFSHSVTIAAAAAIAMIAMMVGVWVPDAARLGFNTAWTAAGVCALAALLRARRAAQGPQRAPWTGFALAAGSWLFGQVAWDLFAVAGTPPSPNVADGGYWGFAV